MGVVDEGKSEPSQNQNENVAAGSTHSAAAGDNDSSVDLAATIDMAQTSELDGEPFVGGDQQIADDVLAAVASVTPDTLTSIEHALDQLTSTTDLFDVPPLDFDPGTGS